MDVKFWLTDVIDSFQPDVVKPENIKLLPHGSYVPKLSDLLLPSMVVAVCFLLTRSILDWFIVAPIWFYFNVDENKKRNIKSFPLLEKSFTTCKSPTQETVTVLSKKSGLSEKTIRVWFKRRKKQEKPSVLKRLQDASWHFIFYLVMSIYGIVVLWNKPWFQDTMHCWIGWPAQAVSPGIYWYYVIEFGFYISAVVMLFTDHKRKDFTELIIHHAVTLFLMLLSFTHNLLRMGSLVLCVHDQVDYILCMAKIAMYFKKMFFADIFFVLFVIVWIVTRLVLYPSVILYSVFIDLPDFAKNDNPYTHMYDTCLIMKVVKASLVVLQILHIIWTILIVKSAAAKFRKGQIEDARSDDECSGISENEESNEEMMCKLTDTQTRSNCILQNNNGVFPKDGYTRHIHTKGDGDLWEETVEKD